MPGGNLHKGAEVHQPGDAAVVVGAGLGVVDNGVHNVQSPLALLEIQAGDEHMAVLFHVHLHFALGADLLDDLAAAADDSRILSTGIWVESILGA